MNKKYRVELTDSEREELNMYISKGENKAYKIKHAHILLKSDAKGSGWTDKQISRSIFVSSQDGVQCASAFCRKRVYQVRWIG